MLTSEDNGKGLVKVYWKDVTQRVAKVKPEFANIVNELSPDKNFPIFLSYYPYGMYVGDTVGLFIPKPEGGAYQLSDPDAPKDVIKHLGYGMDSSPLGMVLDKEVECFMDLKPLGITLPEKIYTPGSFFAIARVLSKKQRRVYAPNGVFSATSGTRSVFMLPQIGCATNHSNLQRDFNILSPPPKSLYEHWSLFKEIIDTNVIECDWRSCVMYFSEKWVEKMLNDKAWMPLKLYIHEMAWHSFEYDINKICYDITFSIIQHTRNLKPNPYLVDTARHLFTITLGAAPAYIPATNNNSFPCDVVQKIFAHSYGLKKYYPTIMQPKHFNFEADKFPIYYSLQHPSVQVFSPKSRKVSSTLFEMRELRHIMRIFTEELLKRESMCAGTIISQIANEIDFKYFHNELDRHKSMLPSMNILKYDNRFKTVSSGNKINGARFASDAKFLRGCISISSAR